MIACPLRDVERQLPMTPLLRKAVEFLRQRNAAGLADGRYEIEGERIFAIVQRYHTIPQNNVKFEYHRKFIDLQFIAEGSEVIGWAPAGRMTITEPYNAGKDIAFGTVPEDAWTPVLLEAGDAAIFRPEDAHAPKLAAGEPGPVMKIVVKIAIE